MLQLREFTPVGETVEFIYLMKGAGAYELPKVVACSTAIFYYRPAAREARARLVLRLLCCFLV